LGHPREITEIAIDVVHRSVPPTQPSLEWPITLPADKILAGLRFFEAHIGWATPEFWKYCNKKWLIRVGQRTIWGTWR